LVKEKIGTKQKKRINMILGYVGSSQLFNGIKYHALQELKNISIYFDLFVGNVISVITLDYELSLKLIYNSANIIKYHNRFKFNYSEKLEIRTIEEFTYIAFIDGYSKITHFYKEDDKYLSENDKNLIIIEDNNYYYMIDSLNNKKTFIKTNTNICYLNEIKKSDNQIIKLELNDKYQITKVISSFNEIIISYDNDELLCVYNKNLNLNIYQKDTKDKYLYMLDGTTTFFLNNNKIIKEIVTGKEIIKYYYCSDIPYRISKIKNYNLNNIIENNVNFRYSLNDTKIIENNKINILEFDCSGNIKTEDIIKL
jgi:hypothetical protein